MLSVIFGICINLFNKLKFILFQIFNTFYNLFVSVYWECLMYFSSVLNKIFDLLNEHPLEVCMNYWQHLKFSSYISYLLFKASVKSIIHSFLPFYYKTSTSDLIKDLPILMSEYGCRNEKED